MKRFLPIFFFLLSTPHPAYSTDQIHDILIIGKDTIYLKSFPLEALNFQIRPFRYGQYDFPNTSCYRGYQATWKVIGNKLFLIEIAKVDAPQEKVDIIQYFAQNNYSPTLIDGMVFADWFSLELTTFPKTYKFQGCVWKPKSKSCKACLRFKDGVMVYNKYKPR